MEVNASVLHPLVEAGQVEAGMGDGVGEEGQIGGAACGAGGVPDIEQAGCVRCRERDGLAGRRREAGAGEDGDFPALDVEFHPSLLSHDPSVQRATGSMNS